MASRILAKRGPHIGLSGGNAEIDYWVTDPAEVDAFLLYCLGTVFLPYANGYQYTMRLSHPDFPWLWVSDVDVQPWMIESPPSGVETTYLDGYKVTVSFTAKCLNRPADPRCPVPDDKNYAVSYVTKEETGTAEMLSLPRDQVEWEHNLDGLPDLATDHDRVITSEVNFATVTPQSTHEFTWHNVTSPPWTAMWDLRGKVNATGWPAARPIQHEPETMLYTGYRVSLTFDESQGEKYTIVYSMVDKLQWEENPQPADSAATGWVGWNHVPRFNHQEGTALWQRVRRMGKPGEYMFKTGDFERLFVQE